MGGPYKSTKKGKPMTTIYDAAILLVDDNPDLLALVGGQPAARRATKACAPPPDCADGTGGLRRAAAPN